LDDQTGFIDIKLTHKDLAEMLGTHRESITKILSTLQKRGLIKMGDQMIHLKDSTELRNWIR